MKPTEALDLAITHGEFSGGQHPSEGIEYYLRRGVKVPDRLLPGGIIKRSSAEVRSALSNLTSEDVRNVAPWWVKIKVG